MSETFQNILTTIGQQKKAIAEAGGAPVNITYFKIGDSNGAYYEPAVGQTDLVNIKYTADFVQGTGSQIIINPAAENEVLYKCFIPANIGGFTVRELGLFDSDDDLILICKLPAQDKFALGAGLYQPLTFTPKMVFTNPNTQVILTITSQITATQEFVTQEMTDHNADPDAHSSLFAEKADLAGSATQTFSVKDATTQYHAVNLGQLIARVPAGTIISYPNATPPSGFLSADGAVVSKTTYADLYAVTADNFSYNHTDSATSANSIGSGNYGANLTKEKAFDNDSTTSWYALQSGAGINGVSYIGQNFGVAKSIKLITIYHADSTYAVTSVKYQTSTDGAAWTDRQTFGISDRNSNLLITNPVSAQSHRLLANSAVENGLWIVYEIQMFETSSDANNFGLPYIAPVDGVYHCIKY